MALFSTCSLGQKPHRTHAVKAVLTVHVPLGLWQLKCRQCRRAGAGDPPPKCALCPGHADETLGKPGSPSSYDGRQPKFGAGELRHGTGLEDLTNFPPLYTLLPGLSPASTGDNMLLRELAAINRTPHSIQNGPTLTCIHPPAPLSWQDLLCCLLPPPAPHRTQGKLSTQAARDVR